MWKPRPDDKPASSNPAPPPSTPSVSAPVAPRESRPPEPAKTSEPFRTDIAAHIGKSVMVKGELSGSEDLYLDGEVQGTIELREHKLIVGPNGRIHANVSAREVVLHGKAEGNITCSERVELKRSCVMTGDIAAQRIVIEDGAFFKGAVDLQRENKGEPRKSVAAAAGPSGGQSSISAAPAISAQTSLLEHK